MFIHPEVSPSQQQQQRGGPHPSASSIMTPPAKKPFPCRYFPYCTNPVCPFIHPDPSSMPMTPQQSSQPQQQQQQQQSSTPTKVPIPCKNGENCKRPGCHFLHPGEENPLADVLVSVCGWIPSVWITHSLIISVNMMAPALDPIAFTSTQSRPCPIQEETRA